MTHGWLPVITVSKKHRSDGKSQFGEGEEEKERRRARRRERATEEMDIPGAEA